MTSAYIIANVEVTDPVQYEDYKKWSTEAMKALLETLVALDGITKKNGFLENNFGA